MRIKLITLLFLSSFKLFSQESPNMKYWFIGDKKIDISGSTASVASESQSSVPGAVYDDNGDAIFKIESNGDIYAINGSSSTYIDALQMGPEGFIAYPADCSGEKYFIIYSDIPNDFISDGTLSCAYLDLANTQLDWDDVIAYDVLDFQLGKNLNSNDNPILYYSTDGSIYLIEIENTLSSATLMRSWGSDYRVSPYFILSPDEDYIISHVSWRIWDSGEWGTSHFFHQVQTSSPYYFWGLSYEGPYVFSEPGSNLDPENVRMVTVGDYLVSTNGNEIAIHKLFSSTGDIISSSSGYNAIEIGYNGKTYVSNGSSIQEVAIDAYGDGQFVGSAISYSSGGELPRQIRGFYYRAISNPEPEIISTYVKSPCYGLSNGSVKHEVIGLPPFIFDWSSSGSSIDETYSSTTNNRPAGNLDLTVYGCNSAYDYHLTSLQVFDTHLEATNPTCVDGNVGTATVNSADNYETGLNYTWSTTETTQSIEDLAIGWYNVTTTNANGCTATEYVYLSQISGLDISFTESPATCFGVNNGELTANVTGSSSYSYLWSTTQTTQTTNGLAVGPTYTVTVSESGSGNGCTQTASSSVGVTYSNPFSVSISPVVQPTCNGVTDGELTADDGAASPTYLWSNSATTATTTGLVSATYTVTVTENAAGTTSGCKVVASQALTAANLEKWQQASGGNNSPVEDHPVAILTDAGDNVFVAGTFIDQTKFGLNAINAASSAGGEKGSFLVKYDECGDIEWVKHTEVNNIGNDVVFFDAVLSGSYVYLIGQRSLSNDFDFAGMGTSLTNTYMWFILEINASTGALNNDISISNTLTASDLVYDMELYNNGTSTDFYAGGKQASSGKATVWKITSGGSVSTFVQDQAGSANSQVRDVEFDATNNRMYMCGTANAAFSFTTGPPESVAGVSDAFAVRYTISSGTPTFTHQRKAGASTSPGYAEGLSLEWDGSSYLYLTGNYKVGINNWGSLTSGFDNAFITKLGASDLSHQWSSHADNALSLSWAKANDICIDASGTVIAAGTFQGSGIRIASGAPGGSPGNSTGTGMWMAAIESNQTNTWTLSAICSTSTENASGVAIAGGSSSTYATGIFEHHLDLQSTSDDLNHANAGSNIDAVYTLRLGDIYTNGSLGQFYKTSLNDENETEMGLNPMAMTAFPNPTSGNITLQWNNSMESPLTLTLMDVSGRLVASPKVVDGRTMTAEMDCSSMPAGIYYLNVESVELVWKAKIIKQ